MERPGISSLGMKSPGARFTISDDLPFRWIDMAVEAEAWSCLYCGDKALWHTPQQSPAQSEFGWRSAPVNSWCISAWNCRWFRPAKVLEYVRHGFGGWSHRRPVLWRWECRGEWFPVDSTSPAEWIHSGFRFHHATRHHPVIFADLMPAEVQSSPSCGFFAVFRLAWLLSMGGSNLFFAVGYGGLFFGWCYFPFSFLVWISISLLLCFAASLRFCFVASLLFCFFLLAAS